MMNDYVCLYITIICNYICITWYIHNSINRLLFVYTCDPVIVSEHCMTRSYRHIGAGARCDVVGIRLISEPLNRAPKNPCDVIFDHPMYTYICIDKKSIHIYMLTPPKPTGFDCLLCFTVMFACFAFKSSQHFSFI